MEDSRGSGLEEEDYWNASGAKGFSWEEGDDSLGMPDLSLNTSPSMDDLVSFEMVPTSSGIALWESRVRDAAKQISAAANKPEPSISQVVGRKDASKLEAELTTVRRKLESVQNNRFHPDPPAETIQNIILGKPFSLSLYRTLKKKEDLLDCALELGDGDAILAVTLMIRRTLKHSKFLGIVCVRPLAAEHLVNYMITRHELTQVTDLLIALGRFNEAGIVGFRQAITTQSLEYRVRNLKQLLHSQMSAHEDAGLVLEQINLLERVSPLLSSESSFKDRQQQSSLSCSVLKALLYLTQYYYTAPENLLHSPTALVKMHKLSKKQTTWVTVRGRAMALAWKDCETLLVGKGWMGGVKAKVAVNMIEMATVLHDARCPVEVLAVVLQAVDSPSDRLDVARRLGVSSVVVDVLLAQKDRSALASYRDSLSRNSGDWLYAENAITTQNVKWKN